MSKEIITKEIIIKEYLCNWFTYEELAGYLCISLEEVKETLDIYCLYNNELNKKVSAHRNNIIRFYNNFSDANINSETDKISIELAKYIIENNITLKQATKELKISKTSVNDLIYKKLPIVSIRDYKKVFEILMQDKTYSTNNNQVEKQVLESYYYLVEGHSLEKICLMQQLSLNVVKKNLTTRLKKISEEKYTNAKNFLSHNLNKQNKEYKLYAN